MKSAYVVLGIPGNASAEDIEAAYNRARELYSPARLASGNGAVDKFNEVKAAYDILRVPDSRAAHDRKLAAPRPNVERRRVTIIEDVPPSRTYLRIGLVLVAVLFCGGLFVSYKNVEARRQQAALELQQKQQEAKEREEQRIDAERLERERAIAKARSDADERNFAAEGRMAAARAANERARQDAVATRMQHMAITETQRQDAARVAEDRRNAQEAQRRTEADKRRIRELCLQQYRRPDC